jgi:hypothetical protein
MFFTQVLPSIAGAGVRAWLLVRLGSDWRNAGTSVVIDRGVGVGLLIALGFAILLLPSGLTALGGYRDVVDRGISKKISSRAGTQGETLLHGV